MLTYKNCQHILCIQLDESEDKYTLMKPSPECMPHAQLLAAKLSFHPLYYCCCFLLSDKNNKYKIYSLRIFLSV